MTANIDHKEERKKLKRFFGRKQWTKKQLSEVEKQDIKPFIINTIRRAT